MSSNPSGLCKCGCGQRTSLAKQSQTRTGAVRGEPLNYVHGHNKRRYEPGFSEEDRGFETHCWVWTGSIDNRGYARVPAGRGSGGSLLAFRVMYEAEFGPIPPKRHLHHRCGITACVRPSHMEIVTPSQHRILHGGFSDQTALAITEAEGSQHEIARRFGVSQGTVWRLKHGLRTYRDRSTD